MVPRHRDAGHEGIVVVDPGAAPFEELHQTKRRAFPRVLDVLLVGDADDEHPRPVEAAPALRVERQGEPLHHVGRHGGVDLAREFDEARRPVELPGLPGEVERVDRHAMPAEAGTGVEGHEAEGLRLGGLDHLPDVDPHGVVDQLQLVHERDIDRAEDVLGQLHGFGRPGRGDRYGADHEPVVESRRDPRRLGPSPPTTLGMVDVRKAAFPGSSRSGE